MKEMEAKTENRYEYRKPQEKRKQMIAPDLFEFAYVPDWYGHLAELERLALPESWKFRKPSRETKNADTPILERYIHTIFRKQVIDFNSESDPRKADSIFHLENECVCFHTGLYTPQYKGIYGYFEKNNFSDSLRDWYFRGFCDELSPKLRYIEPLPQKPVYHMAQSGINFNPEWPIRVNVNHILGDEENLERIPAKIRKVKNLPLLFETAVELGRRKSVIEPGLVVPQGYQGRVQYLLPVYLTNMQKPDLAMTLTVMDGYYLGNTCLTLEMAYLNARLDFSRWVPEGFGTGDLVIVADDTLYIVDLKYGKGIAVSAEWNPQMLLYSLGALELFGSLYDIEKVNMTIHQPRLENVSTFEITVHDLMEWAEQELMPKAEMAAKGEGEFAVGDWCRFCKAKNTCRARAEEYLRLAQMEFKPPELLSEEEIAEVLKVADELAKWSADVYAYAQDEAITHGRVWNGFKLVEGRSNRKYVNEEEVADAAKAAGYEDIYKKSLIGITEMEKLMGKKDFQKILGSLVYKPQGKITLVPESDKRPPIQTETAEADFKEDE